MHTCCVCCTCVCGACVCDACVCNFYHLLCLPIFPFGKKKLWISHVRQERWRIRNVSVRRCLFCLSKQHMQQQSLLRKGTSRRGRRQFFIYQFQLSSLGFWEFNHPHPPCNINYWLNCCWLRKRTTPKRIMRPAIGFPFWLCLLSAPNWQRQTLSPSECGGTGGRREKWVIKCK